MARSQGSYGRLATDLRSDVVLSNTNLIGVMRLLCRSTVHSSPTWASSLTTGLDQPELPAAVADLVETQA
jgi:hypothetical protein